MLTQNFLTKKKFDPKKIWPTNFWSKKILTKKNFDRKKFWPKNVDKANLVQLNSQAGPELGNWFFNIYKQF